MQARRRTGACWFAVDDDGSCWCTRRITRTPVCLLCPPHPPPKKCDKSRVLLPSRTVLGRPGMIGTVRCCVRDEKRRATLLQYVPRHRRRWLLHMADPDSLGSIRNGYFGTMSAPLLVQQYQLSTNPRCAAPGGAQVFI